MVYWGAARSARRDRKSSTDKDGGIRSVDADPDYTRRSEPAHTAAALRQLAAW
jgi:hypothetical protein